MAQTGPCPEWLDEAETIRKLHTVTKGSGWVNAKKDTEVVLLTTEASPVQIHNTSKDGSEGSVIRELRFHIGWEGVPAAWSHAALSLTRGEVASFEATVDGLTGPSDGPFAPLLSGLPKEGLATLELQLKTMADMKDISSTEDGFMARMWLYNAGQGWEKPKDFVEISVHVQAWATNEEELWVDAVPPVAEPTGKCLLDTKASGGAPVSFLQMNGTVCSALERAIEQMRPGDEARIVLIADVKGLGVSSWALGKETSELHAHGTKPLTIQLSDLAFTNPETLDLPLEKSKARAEEHRQAGNTKFKEGDFSRAIKRYDLALEILKTFIKRAKKADPNYEIETEIAEQMKPVLQNTALCCLKVNPIDPSKALERCEEALDLDPNSAKAHLYKGRALEKLGVLDEAEFELVEACKLLPKDAAIRTDLARIRKIIKDGKEKEKGIYNGMFGKMSGFMSDARDTPATKVVPTDDGKYVCRQDPASNPYAAKQPSDSLKAQAEALQTDGRLEDAVWAWEAELTRTKDSGDWHAHWSCWTELAQLYMDLNLDAQALRCLNSIMPEKDASQEPLKSTKSTRLLLQSICFLNEAPDNTADSVNSCIETWCQETDCADGDTQPDLLNRLKAMDSSPDFGVDAAVARALLHLVAGEHKQSVEALASVAQKCEASSKTFRPATRWNMLGAVLANSGKKDQALLAYTQALRSQRHYPRALTNQGIAQQALNDHHAAATSFAQALAIVPAWASEELWAYLGASARQLENPGSILEAVKEQAVSGVQELLKRDSNSKESDDTLLSPRSVLQKLGF